MKVDLKKKYKEKLAEIQDLRQLMFDLQNKRDTNKEKLQKIKEDLLEMNIEFRKIEEELGLKQNDAKH